MWISSLIQNPRIYPRPLPATPAGPSENEEISPFTGSRVPKTVRQIEGESPAVERAERARSHGREDRK